MKEISFTHFYLYNCGAFHGKTSATGKFPGRCYVERGGDFADAIFLSLAFASVRIVIFAGGKPRRECCEALSPRRISSPPSCP